MTKTELKQNITKIKKLLKQRDYDIIDSGIELARGGEFNLSTPNELIDYR